MAKRQQIKCFPGDRVLPGSSHEHERIVRETLLAVGRLHFVRAWRNEVGVGIKISNGERFQYGLIGSADILAIMAPYGRLVGLEVKSGKAKLRDTQINYRIMIEKFGGLYFVVKSANEAVEFLSANYSGDSNLFSKKGKSCKR